MNAAHRRQNEPHSAERFSPPQETEAVPSPPTLPIPTTGRQPQCPKNLFEYSPTEVELRRDSSRFVIAACDLKRAIDSGHLASIADLAWPRGASSGQGRCVQDGAREQPTWLSPFSNLLNKKMCRNTRAPILIEAPNHKYKCNSPASSSQYRSVYALWNPDSAEIELHISSHSVLNPKLYFFYFLEVLRSKFEPLPFGFVACLRT
jgi:hypothetical protein